MILSYATPTYPQGMFGAAPPPGWAQLAPVGFQGFRGQLGRFGAAAPPPPPPPGGHAVPKSCPPPGASGPDATTSTPVPPVRWIRYQDRGMQETYARLYGMLREPAVLGVKVIPEEQADLMSRQIIDAIIALPQSEELRFRVGCMAKSYVTSPLAIATISLIVLGLGGVGYWAVRRRSRLA